MAMAVVGAAAYTNVTRGQVISGLFYCGFVYRKLLYSHTIALNRSAVKTTPTSGCV